MTIEDPVLPLWEWLFGGYGVLRLLTSSGNVGAFWSLLIVLLLLALAVLFVAYLSFAAQYGPIAGARRVAKMFGTAASDLLSISPRRVFAMSRLAFQEAIRMRVLVAFAVFVLVMLFASWYLDVKTDSPAQLYMGVVLGWTNLLVLILALFLSTFSLPNDIKNHTIYTVVTKPVRLGEVILGRMIGFTVIGTMILVVMCLLSYIFVWRGLSHSHQLQTDNAGVPLLSEDTQNLDEDGNAGLTGSTTEASYHRHRVSIDFDGTGFTDVQKGHRHRVDNVNPLAAPVARLMRIAREVRESESVRGSSDDVYRTQAYRNIITQAGELSKTAAAEADGAPDESQRQVYEALAEALSGAVEAAQDREIDAVVRDLTTAQKYVNDFAIARFEVGPPEGQLQAIMPKYGQLTFLDRAGRPTDKGINVGNEWTYRSYIEGGSLAAAIWTFNGITADRFPAHDEDFRRGVPLDLTIRVFRTYKGDINKGIAGSLEIVEYLTDEEKAAGKRPLVSEPLNFRAKEFTPDRKYIPRKLVAQRVGGPRLRDIDLFDDLAHDGKLIVRIRCQDPAQYFGAAMPDVYVWTGNNYFFVNFVKGYCTIWCQMVLVISFGVMLSTFLSGPVAMLATVMSYVTGYFTQFVVDVSTGKLEGGGPLESLIRIIQQKNLVTPLEQGGRVVSVIDKVMLAVMWLFSYLMPDYSKLETSAFVSQGYDIPWQLMEQHVLTTLVYFVVLATLGYLILKSREVAA